MSFWGYLKENIFFMDNVKVPVGMINSELKEPGFKSRQMPVLNLKQSVQQKKVIATKSFRKENHFESKLFSNHF